MNWGRSKLPKYKFIILLGFLIFALQSLPKCISSTVLTQSTICINSNTTGSARPIHLNSLLQHPYELKICMNFNKTDSARPVHLSSLLQHKVVLRAEFTNTVCSTRKICVSYTSLKPPEFTGYEIWKILLLPLLACGRPMGKVCQGEAIQLGE